MRSKDKLILFENILAKVGIDGDVLGEYTRALSLKNGLDAYNSVQSLQNLPPNPPMGGLPPQNSPQMGTSTPQEQLPPQMPV